MEDKRISIRFRMDNDMDRKAWDELEAMAVKRNISKNAIAIELILSGVSCFKEINREHEIIADMVADRILQKIDNIQITENTSKKTLMLNDPENFNETKAALQTDEPVPLGEDVLDFLSTF